MRTWFVVSFFTLLLLTGSCDNTPPEVNIYTSRHYASDDALFEQFTHQSGIAVNIIKAPATQLLQRLESEGAQSPADILLTTDVARLEQAVERKLLQPTASDKIQSVVPAYLRHPENLWVTLTKRIRVIAYHPERVDTSALPDYESLAQDRWEGRVLARSGNHVYNQSLLASLIAAHGTDSAARWAEGVVSNMARKPAGGDRDQLKAIAAGVGDVALINNYYLAHMQYSANSSEQQVAATVRIHFPNQQNRGAHVNISGAGITAHAPHYEEAVKLIEYLLSREAQKQLMEQNFEYPVRTDVSLSETLRNWGGFREDTLPLVRIAQHHRRAVKMMNETGWR